MIDSVDKLIAQTWFYAFFESGRKQKKNEPARACFNLLCQWKEIDLRLMLSWEETELTE